MKRKILLAVIVLVVILGAIWLFTGKATAPKSTAGTNPTSPSPTAANSGGFNKQQFSLTDPTSIWVIVNKQHPLNPINYVPSDLVVPNVPLRVPGNETMQVRSVTATALETMFAAAKAEGINLMLASGYRSYAYQVGLYNGYVQSQNQAAADTYSARPGYSEHQTGLAADLEPVSRNCELNDCFANTSEGQWLAANAYKYGFIIRYKQDIQSITGYEYEPWHVRYIGVALATELHRTGVETLEQFFGVTGGTTYKN